MSREFSNNIFNTGGLHPDFLICKRPTQLAELLAYLKTKGLGAQVSCEGNGWRVHARRDGKIYYNKNMDFDKWSDMTFEEMSHQIMYKRYRDVLGVEFFKFVGRQGWYDREGYITK